MAAVITRSPSNATSAGQRARQQARTIPELAKQLEVSKNTSHRWRAQHGGMKAGRRQAAEGDSSARERDAEADRREQGGGDRGAQAGREGKLVSAIASSGARRPSSAKAAKRAPYLANAWRSAWIEPRSSVSPTPYGHRCEPRGTRLVPALRRPRAGSESPLHTRSPLRLPDSSARPSGSDPAWPDNSARAGPELVPRSAAHEPSTGQTYSRPDDSAVADLLRSEPSQPPGDGSVASTARARNSANAIASIHPPVTPRLGLRLPRSDQSGLARARLSAHHRPTPARNGLGWCVQFRRSPRAPPGTPGRPTASDRSLEAPPAPTAARTRAWSRAGRTGRAAEG